MRYLLILFLCIAGCSCGENTLEKKSRAYVEKQLRNDWEIIRVMDNRYSAKGNYRRVFVEMAKFGDKPWDNADTCGFLWFDENDNMVRDGIVGNRWQKGARGE